MEKVQKKAQFSFCGQKKAFHYEIALRGIQPYLLHGGALDLFWTATKAPTFWRILRYIFYSIVKEITFLKWNLCIYKCFIDVQFILVSVFNEKVQNMPRLDSNCYCLFFNKVCIVGRKIISEAHDASKMATLHPKNCENCCMESWEDCIILVW